jgi:hypothetical protein
MLDTFLIARSSTVVAGLGLVEIMIQRALYISRNRSLLIGLTLMITYLSFSSRSTPDSRKRTITGMMLSSLKRNGRSFGAWRPHGQAVSHTEVFLYSGMGLPVAVK